MATEKKNTKHYVNNKEFSQAVHDYVHKYQEAKAEGRDLVVPDYIASCFLKIAEGLSYKPNFIRYTYREEMVMDAVENCLKAIHNYDIERATRTKNPNAFAYFTQISWYAFLRRLQKEKKQQDIRFKFIEQGGFEEFMFNDDEDYMASDEYTFVDELRTRIEQVHRHDRALKEYTGKEDKDPEGIELFMGGY